MITAKSIGTGGLGRFGNQMFTIAGCIGIAIKSGQPFAFPHWKVHDNALFGQPVDDMEEYFINPLPRIPDSLTFTDIPYHWEYKDYNVPTGNWNICSHLQDERYFKHCMPLIRDTFRMKGEPEQNGYVAIHYRAGDYIDDPNAYHPRCSKEYYEKAMDVFRKEGPCTFKIFTDDIDAFWKMMIVPNFKHEYPLPQPANYISDFKQMKKCKHFITANSSFSLFAAILGEHPDKKIICPSRWFGTAANGMKFEGYPENAIVI